MTVRSLEKKKLSVCQFQNQAMLEFLGTARLRSLDAANVCVFNTLHACDLLYSYQVHACMNVQITFKYSKMLKFA